MIHHFFLFLMKILFIPLIDIIKSYFEKYYKISQFLISINLLFILKKKKEKIIRFHIFHHCMQKEKNNLQIMIK